MSLHQYKPLNIFKHVSTQTGQGFVKSVLFL